MREDNVFPLSSDSTKVDVVIDKVREIDAVRREFTSSGADDFDALTPTDRDQLAHDIAEIERATATLRRAQPDLESWAHPPAPTIGKAEPVWLLIGALWLSTALVTIGAAVAIAALVG